MSIAVPGRSAAIRFAMHAGEGRACKDEAAARPSPGWAGRPKGT